jgi:hypothetical protein
VTIPGLPFVPGGSSVHPERALTWFLDRWSPQWQQTILETHRRRGYTHFVLSWPDSRDGNGQSVAQFVATATKVKEMGFYVVVFLGSKVYDPRDASAAEWAPRIDPVLAALIAARAIDVAVVGWELDLWNVPGDRLQGIIDHVASITVPAGIRTYVHFSPHRISWQRDGETTLDWWNRQRGKLTGVLYQGDTSWTVGMFQARLNDVQVRFAQLGDSGFGHPFDVVAFETVASLQFDGPTDEDRGDLTGYELLCTPGPVPIMGFGNGARLPDGRATATRNLAPRPTTSRSFGLGQLSLRPGQSVVLSGAWLAFQGDGNLVVYNSSGAPLWASGTADQDCSAGCEADFQGDGNLVLYNNGRPYWATGTDRQGGSLLFQNSQPYLQIKSGDGFAVWSTLGPSLRVGVGNSLRAGQSVALSGAFLIFQGDGNLVVYSSHGDPLWSSGTAGRNCGISICEAAFQGDGNLVLYENGTPYWATGTEQIGTSLIFQRSTPYLQILDASDVPVWTSQPS